VQLSGAPFPTTVAGIDVSTGWPSEGMPGLQVPFGFPAGHTRAPALPGALEHPAPPISNNAMAEISAALFGMFVVLRIVVALNR
jgi:hypothetical protein